MISPAQQYYYAWDLSHKKALSDESRFTGVLSEAKVDLNPHQVEAALFALRSPISSGVLLADEVGLGKTIEAGLVICQLWAERKRKLERLTWLHHVSLWSIPLVYMAGQAGWIVAEVGRQPWVIEGLLPTKAAVSSVSVGAVQTTFFLFVAIFTLFLAIEIRILLKAIQQGPQIESK